MTCRVGRGGGAADAGSSPHDFTRPLLPKGGRTAEAAAALEEGSVVTTHRGCTPRSRLSVPAFMLLCLGGAAAALLFLRARERQRAAFSF